MALIVLTETNAFAAQCTLIRRVMYVNIPLSIILVKYLRAIGTAWDEFGNEMWIGVTPHKNNLGAAAMIAAVYCLFEIVKSRRFTKVVPYIVLLVMASWLLKGSPTSRSNTAIAVSVMGAVMICVLSRLRHKARSIGRYAIVGALMTALVLATLQVIEWSSNTSLISAGIEASGRDVTLSGRTELWSDLLEIWLDAPVLGVGYGAFWVGNTHNLWDRHIWRPRSGHNGYIDTAMDLGFVGLCLLIAAVCAAYRTKQRLLTTDFDQGVLHLTFISIIVVQNFTETTFLKGSELWFLFLLCGLNVPPGCVRAKLAPSWDVCQGAASAPWPRVAWAGTDRAYIPGGRGW
jgi:O-antigen ligase